MNIHVVLVEPTRSWNIGSIARVMNNMGITSLRLVNPCDHLHHKAYALAVNSAHILESARVYQDLGEAVSECELVIGTSARARGQNTAMQNSWSLPGLLENYSKVTDVAVVFGGEENGLNNNDATVCNEMVKIPAFGESTSLNLSQAVMVILYECSKFVHGEKSLPVQKARAPAPSSEVEHMKNHIYSLFSIKFQCKCS